tara:strand:- start:6660 stop:7067 length:408 start_codon:yes stop_codon:yes gene_type:complete
MTIFDWLNEISYNKTPWSSFTEKDQESFNRYMINRFISMKSDYIDIVNLVQKYPLSDKNLYNFYCKTIPKKKTFFRYIKPKKSKINSLLVSILAQDLNISEREIKDSQHLISKNLSKSILQQRGIDEKQIKKILK